MLSCAPATERRGFSQSVSTMTQRSNIAPRQIPRGTHPQAGPTQGETGVGREGGEHGMGEPGKGDRKNMKNEDVKKTFSEKVGRGLAIAPVAGLALSTQSP